VSETESRPATGLDEHGSVLLISLVMLVVFTLIGATIITLASTEGNIATNHAGATQALFVAESGAQTAYASLAANNFQGFTHQPDGTPEVAEPLLPTNATTAPWSGSGRRVTLGTA
jgi:Tfp pilus assembly protein PilX